MLRVSKFVHVHMGRLCSGRTEKQAVRVFSDNGSTVQVVRLIILYALSVYK